MALYFISSVTSAQLHHSLRGGRVVKLTAPVRDSAHLLLWTAVKLQMFSKVFRYWWRNTVLHIWLQPEIWRPLNTVILKWALAQRPKKWLLSCFRTCMAPHHWSTNFREFDLIYSSFISLNENVPETMENRPEKWMMYLYIKGKQAGHWQNLTLNPAWCYISLLFLYYFDGCSDLLCPRKRVCWMFWYICLFNFCCLGFFF